MKTICVISIIHKKIETKIVMHTVFFYNFFPTYFSQFIYLYVTGYTIAEL